MITSCLNLYNLVLFHVSSCFLEDLTNKWHANTIYSTEHWH